MSKLSTTMNSLLTADVIKRLNLRKIFTITDILQEDSEKLIHVTNLPYKDIIQLRKTLISNYSAFPCNGLDTYNDLVANSAIVPTGITSLDDMLDGGFLTGNLYEICGYSGTGKTQLCLSVSANIAQYLKQPVHYIDTRMAFSGRRILCMLESRGCSEQEIGDIMERIHVTRIGNVNELLTFLHHLKSNLQQEQDGKNAVRLIIVDSLPAVFFPFLGEKGNDRLGFMNMVVSVMKYIALEYHVAFLSVNLVTKWYGEESASNELCEMLDERGGDIHNQESTRPSLGKYWLHVPSTRMHITKSVIGSDRHINIIKTINSANVSCSLAFTNSGLV